jgi:CRP-like cAMP-binding protein
MLPPRYTVIRRGEHPDAMYFIHEGQLIVRHKDRRVVLSAGSFFGEMALLDGGPRTATVTATTSITLYALTEWVFRGLLAEHAGIAMHTLETMAGRLRSATKAASA